MNHTIFVIITTIYGIMTKYVPNSSEKVRKTWKSRTDKAVEVLKSYGKSIGAILSAINDRVDKGCEFDNKYFYAFLEHRTYVNPELTMLLEEYAEYLETKSK